MEENEKNSLVNRGCWSRLKACMRRAQAGENLIIAFLGGSITQGSAATSDERCYAALTWSWWQEKFPKSAMTYINAGIGGTDSLFGGARAEKDVLSKNPDVIFVDFTVNDKADVFYQETFEGLLRRIYASEGKPAVVVLNNVFYDSGYSAQVFHNLAAARYGIPCVSAREGIYEAIRRGNLQAEELTADFLHPNDRGHRLLAGLLTDFLEEVLKDVDSPEEEGEFLGPLTANAYEKSQRFQAGQVQAQLEGFQEDTRPKEGYYDHFKEGWIGRKKGDRITFWLRCANLAVQYRKSVRHPEPKEKITVDGQEMGILDGNFEETWGDCLFLQPILHHGMNCLHEVEIEIVDGVGQEGEPFYLMSLICA